MQGKAHDNRLHPNIWSTLQRNLSISGKVYVNTLYPCICDDWKHEDPPNGHQDYIFKCKFIKEEIYMEQPQGFIQEGGKHLMCKLHKSLYGLKQSSRMWNWKFDAILKNIGFVTNDVNF